jgi:hypothetical protein
MVDYDGTDWLGFVEGIETDKKLRVRFYSYTNNEVDFIDDSKAKPFKCTSDFPIGAAVQVYSASYKQWYAAKVLKKFSCLHYVHYDGYGDEWDEWVSPTNIKKK